MLGAFPAQPLVSIIWQADKLEHIPSLAKAMRDAGYNTSYYYGGEMDFANMNAYVHANDFIEINGGDSFPSEKNYSKWGAPDQYVLQKQEKDIPRFPQPFFSYLVTLSSHEPFEVPMITPFSGKQDVHDKFRHAIYYTDHCLGDYFKYVKAQPWYKNTLFILVADHGHPLPRDRQPYEPAHQHIPLIFFGDVIKPQFQGKRIDALGNQTDIVATILAQLNLPHSQFNWSNNLMNTYRNNFTYYSFDNGFGWISPKDTFAFENVSRSVINADSRHRPVDSTELKKGQAYLQELFNQYLSY